MPWLRPGRKMAKEGDSIQGWPLEVDHFVFRNQDVAVASTVKKETIGHFVWNAIVLVLFLGIAVGLGILKSGASSSNCLIICALGSKLSQLFFLRLTLYLRLAWQQSWYINCSKRPFTMTTKPLPILSMGQIWFVAIFTASVTGLPVALFCDTHPWVIASPILLGVILILSLEFSSERRMAANHGLSSELLHVRASYPAVQFNTPLWKCNLDVFTILLATPLLLPLGLIIAMIVRVTSKGSILYAQTRVGYKGRSFLIYKFRTWYVTEITTVQGHGYQTEYRHELTRIGRLLRLSGMDTLPNLINVLRGEMSLVGPSPCSTMDFQKYLP